MQRIVLRLRSSIAHPARFRLGTFATFHTFQQHSSRLFGANHGSTWNQASVGANRLTNTASRAPKIGLSRSAFAEVQGNVRYSSQSSWPAPARRPTPASRNARISKDGYTHFAGGSGNRNGGSSTNTPYILGLSAAGVGLYVYSNLDYAPFTGRRRILGMSRRQEMAMGQEGFQMLLSEFHGRILDPRHPESKRVRRVVAKIATAVKRLDPSLTEDFVWQVAVADENEPNALCVPGGRILITTGLLRILPTDDDLAVVLAHELVHGINRHGAESMHLHRMLMPIVFIANQVFDMRWFPSMLLTFFFSLPYKRNLEYEADEVGLQLCVEACYDPRVAPGVFRRLASLQNEKSGTFLADKVAPFLSTHPQSAERANRLNAALPAKLEQYKHNCTMQSSFRQF